MNLVKTYFADLKKEFAGYNGQKLTKDVMSGITVAAVALPLALAFGVSSGATAASGLVTAILGGIIISLFSGASFQISGPTGAMSAILITLAAQYGLQGIFMASFLAGVILLAAGVLKLGRMIYYIPSSVITGFTSGIAIIIALGQLDNFFGVKSEGDLAIMKLISYFTDGFSPNCQAVGIGTAVILFMLLWPKKLNEKIPSSLAAIILVVIVGYFVDFNVEVVGDIPKSIMLEDRLSIGSISMDQFSNLLVPAFSIAALGMIESLLCGASASKMKKEDFNADRELVAQGIGNMVIPLFGGVPATAAIARTSVAIKAGCETRLAGIIHAVILLLSMFVIGPIMSTIPLSALAGVLMVTAWRMNDWENIDFIFGHKFKPGILKFVITMIATVLLDLTKAILIGVAVSAFLLIVKLTDIDVTVADIDKDRLDKVGVHVPEVSKKVKVAYLTGTIFFAVVDKLSKKIKEEGKTEGLILSMRGVPVIDVSGIQALTELVKEMNEMGTEVYLTSVQPKVYNLMEQGGFIDLIGREYVFDSAQNAILVAMEEHM